MSKSFMIEFFQRNAGMSVVKATELTDGLLDGIVAELKTSERFSLPGFGTFTVHTVAARRGLNPRTGEGIDIKEGRTVRFKPSPLLKGLV